MLFVTTDSPAEIQANKGRDIIAFGLPSIVGIASTNATANHNSNTTAMR